MANCDNEPCDCPVCLDNRNLLRLECNGPRGTHHYLCRDCLMKLRQFSEQEEDSFRFNPPRYIKWKKCPTCRGPIKRASRYNALLRHPGGETREESERREADPEAHRGYLQETELQDEEFARDQSNLRISVFARELMDFDNNIRRLEQERGQLVREVANAERQLNQVNNQLNPRENNNRFFEIATLVCGCAIIVYHILCITTPLITAQFIGGGDNENNKKIDRSNSIGVIYIGLSEGIFGVWWSTIQNNGTILNILINNEDQYQKLLETYKFTTNPQINIATQMLEVTKLNTNKTYIKKAGSRKKRKMKRRSSRQKR